ncbi:glycosyltransferase family 4 protein [Urechidicola vernalis]|uniref:Glycosyltransferase family 4 protein n=1 Tax=Urechidicola vernalis TaxID=3075600 RepID=A0ABU2Y275_9FLAO|nr:glycosyltransferase family 4 protein [Urechidicola sp. P050]MDT0552260.1 glycosyltransferase family 4 protein [Urechidicola sp. P050]
MKDSKKILIVSSEFPPQPGGIGNHAYNLSKKLTEQGKEVVVYTNNRSKESIAEEMSFDTRQIFKTIRINRSKLGFLTYFKRILYFFRTFQREKPDKIVASGRFSLWLVGLTIFFHKKEILGIVHGSEVNLKNKFHRSFTNKALKKFDKIIAVSAYTKKLISNINKEVTIIPNGIEIKDFKFTYKRKNSKELQLITVGALSQRKGQHNVINALPSLKKQYPDISYHIVGIPSDRDRLLAQAKKLGVEKQIAIYGVVSQKRLIQLLEDSDIFVMLSEESSDGEIEGFGIAILEANALGIPAIGSINSGIESSILNYKSGLLIDPKDANQLLEAVKMIKQDHNLYAQEARIWALEHDWHYIINKYIKLIES